MRKAGIRWSKMYESLNQTQRVQLYDKLVADRESKERLEEEYRKRRAQPEPEDNMDILNHTLINQLGDFQHGTGGGYRVIRGTNSFT